MSSRFIVSHNPKLKRPKAAKEALLSDGVMQDLPSAFAKYLQRETSRLPDDLYLPPGRFVLAMGSSGELLDSFNNGWRGMGGIRSTRDGEDVAVWYWRTRVRVGYTATIFFVGANETAGSDAGRAAWGWRNAKNWRETYVTIAEFRQNYIPRTQGLAAFDPIDPDR